MKDSLLCFLFLAFFYIDSSAQIFLQLEKFNSPKTIKFQEGDYLKIKTTSQPEQWELKKILHILPGLGQLALEEDLIPLRDILQLQIERPQIKTLGQRLIQFGFTWFTFATILEVTNRYDFDNNTILIGGGAFVVGSIFKFGFGSKTYKMGRNSRMRILDLSFPVNPYNN